MSIRIKHKNFKYSIYNKSIQFVNVDASAYLDSIGSEITISGKLPFYQLITLSDLIIMCEKSKLELSIDLVLETLKELFKYEFIQLEDGFVLLNNKSVLNLNRVNIWCTRHSLRYIIGENGEKINSILIQFQKIENTPIKRVNIIQTDFLLQLNFMKTANVKKN